MVVQRGVQQDDGRTLAAIVVGDVTGSGGDGGHRRPLYVHFADRETYLVALHREFHDRLRSAIRAAAAGLPPGHDRLVASATAYLDGCLAATGVKGVLTRARGVAEIADEVTASNDRFARAASPDFVALGSPLPLETARLFVAMTAEVAALEAQGGRRIPRLRRALALQLDVSPAS
jgi:hypothetical protein